MTEQLVLPDFASDTERCSHENHVILVDSGDVGRRRVLDLQCTDCGHIYGAVEYLYEQRTRKVHDFPPQYLKKRYKVECGCAVNCGSFWCRRAA